MEGSWSLTDATPWRLRNLRTPFRTEAGKTPPECLVTPAGVLASKFTLRCVPVAPVGVERGGVWLAEIPFTSGTASELRPVLLLWLEDSSRIPAEGAP